ncbi:hypothetical protein DFH07DRAFT_985756 [Mycena maculata]|uniref:Uncharacterized protein n=1 Tax=Mycena maculata TaxID=230809 RepID=A0AAD7I9E7_9AGAR|nr:hypothetical protein DFH07DRAFT_985756 [Mycena maculata]
MVVETSARVSSTPLRRRMHILERASHSFTTAESTTRNGDADDESEDMPPLPSPPTSHEYGYDEEEEEEQEQVSNGEDAGTSGTPQSAASFAKTHKEDEEHPLHTPGPWYKPSYPVLFALVSPIGNWLTGGDHLKDLVLLLLLVFYLHHLIEVPWGLYHAARPRRSPSPSVSSAPTLTAMRAKSELRTIELSLLLLCLLTPVLGVVLLRSLASLITSGSGTPISWFSTSIFAFFTAVRPLRELVSRISARTSTLHAHVHAHTAPTADPQVDALRAQVAKLEATVAKLAQREDALYAFVEDAVAPLEKGVRRVERRVGKLRAKKDVPAREATPPTNTIFIPAQRPKTPSLLSWFASPAPSSIAIPPPSPHLSTSPTSMKRRALDSIPEEGEPGPASVQYATTSGSAYPAPPVRAWPAPPPSDTPMKQWAAVAATLAREGAAALVVLTLWPLWVVLLPVRGALRFLVGVV